jgi:UDP-4-amino-4,6-dideoxy-N-acetyl-beta-L-altrosamine transaminase
MNLIPYARQDINQADIDEVVAVLRSDYLTQGPVVPAFEKAVTDYCGAKFAVAVNSATSALHLACLALGVAKNDIVWTSAITFAASANTALYCGAIIDFVDIDPKSYNISIEHLTEKLIKAEKTGSLPKILIPVHMCGQSCDMAKIYQLSLKYGFKIIEDASHAIGAKYKHEFVGNCKYSDITVFSFHPVKIITTGEGGMAVTNNPCFAERMQLLRSHGIQKDLVDTTLCRAEEVWNYQQVVLGFNYRMTDIQAALGVSQIKRIDKFVSDRREIAKNYDLELSKLPLLTPWQNESCDSSYHLYVIRLELEKIKKKKRQFYDELIAKGIQVNYHYIPVYRHPYYQKMGFSIDYCPEAENYFLDAISIPMYPTLSENLQKNVVRVIDEVLSS